MMGDDLIVEDIESDLCDQDRIRPVESDGYGTKNHFYPSIHTP
jgi:hypothetical protein